MTEDENKRRDARIRREDMNIARLLKRARGDRQDYLLAVAIALAAGVLLFAFVMFL